MGTRSWHLAAAIILLVLLAVVATVQYRWLGDVSRAERERLQASLRTRASDFATSLDTDVTRAYSAFGIGAAQFDADPFAAVNEAAERAARDAATGRAVKAIFVAEPGPAGSVRRLDASTRTLAATGWPSELAALGQRLATAPTFAVPGLPLPPGFLGDALDGDAPALIVPIATPDLPPQPAHGDLFVRTIPLKVRWQSLVVWLDREQLQTQLVMPLVARHFGDPESSEFNVALVSSASGAPVFNSGNTPRDPKTVDLVSDVFALRLGDLHWSREVAPPASSEAAQAVMRDRVAITIVRRGSESPSLRGGGGGSAWRLLVQARRGSLDAVVARSRLRNLGVSLGALGILGASIALILVAAAREQRAARQQLEFVASVSHELRTPLAVIRSAGENLADGVVSGAQVAQYGALIRTEGRRLSDMVERVMDFAGMSSGTLMRGTRPTDVKPVLAAVVAALQADAHDRNLALHLRAAADLPSVDGDADALRSALQNAIGNAIKYSPANTTIEIDLVATTRALRVTVNDRGIGIDASDLPHVFEPFYRGRRAVDAQIRGSGVGLSVVRKVVDAHGGEVRIASREGGGTTLTIELPVPRSSHASGE